MEAIVITLWSCSWVAHEQVWHTYNENVKQLVEWERLVARSLKNGDSNYRMSLLPSFTTFWGFVFRICTACMSGMYAPNFKWYLTYYELFLGPFLWDTLYFRAAERCMRNSASPGLCMRISAGFFACGFRPIICLHWIERFPWQNNRI